MVYIHVCHKDIEHHRQLRATGWSSRSLSGASEVFEAKSRNLLPVPCS